jgi:hypothetical protein
MTLQRLVIDLRAEEMILRVLYRCKDGPGPNTKARRREATELARAGLTQALAALEDGARLPLQWRTAAKLPSPRSLSFLEG